LAAAVVQSAKENGHFTGGGSYGISLPSPVTPGNCVVVASSSALFNSTDNAGGTVSDNQGNTYTVQKHIKNDQVVTTLFAAFNVASNGGLCLVTFTQTNTGETYNSLVIAELSGVVTTSPKDRDASFTGFTFSPSSGVTTATSQANAIALAALGYDYVGGGAGSPDPIPVTTAAGWANIDYEYEISSMHPCALSFKVLAATGTQECTWNTSAPSYSPWETSAVIVVLKATAGGPVYKNLTGTSAGRAANTASAITRQRRLTGSSAGRAIATATLAKVGLKNLTGTSVGLATTTGTPTRRRALTGTADGRATTAATLSKQGAYPVHTYSTAFSTTENPLSEGGIWRTGLTHGLLWKDYRTTGGNAVGTQDGGPSSGPPLFDDSIACLVGTFADNQYARGTVYTSGAPTGGWPEVELLLRWEINANYARGYEVFFSTDGATGGGHDYCAINRWRGARADPGDFSDFYGLANVPCPNVVNGDVIEATIIGNTIRAYKNGVLIATGVDDGGAGAPWTGGTPGIGHNWWNDNTVDAAKAATYGWQDFQAHSLGVPQNLTGTSGGRAVTSATLSRQRRLSGLSAGLATTSGVINRQGYKNLTGRADGRATTTGQPARRRLLQGASSAGRAITSASLSVVAAGLVYWDDPPEGLFAPSGSLVLRWEGDQFVTETGDPHVTYSAGQFHT